MHQDEEKLFKEAEKAMKDAEEILFFKKLTVEILIDGAIIQMKLKAGYSEKEASTMIYELASRNQKKVKDFYGK